MAITYAPRTTNRAGEILGKGIENVGEAFGRRILRSKEQEKEQKEKDRVLKEENDKLDLHLEGLGYSAGQIASMSIGQKRGAVEKAATEMTMERLERERTTWKQEQGDRSRGEGQRKAFENAQLYQRGMTPAGAEPIDMAQAMRNAGVTDPKMFEQGLAMGEAMKGPWEPSVVEKDGLKWAMMSPNNAKPLSTTGGGAPPAAPRVVGYVPGPDGKPSTLAIVQDVKGKWTIANTAGGKLSAVDAYTAYQAVENAKKSSPGWFERTFGKEQPAPAAAAPAAPGPAAAAPTLIPSGWEGTTNAGGFPGDFFNSMEGDE